MLLTSAKDTAPSTTSTGIYKPDGIFFFSTLGWRSAMLPATRGERLPALVYKGVWVLFCVLCLAWQLSCVLDTPICTQHTDCPTGQSCDFDVAACVSSIGCQRVCQADADCNGCLRSKFCVQGSCQKERPVITSCTNQTCQTDKDCAQCPSKSACRVTTTGGECVVPTETLVSDFSCDLANACGWLGDGWFCILTKIGEKGKKYCIRGCTSDADCALRTGFQGFRCFPSPTNTKQCRFSCPTPDSNEGCPGDMRCCSASGLNINFCVPGTTCAN